MSPFLKKILRMHHKQWCQDLGIKPAKIRFLPRLNEYLGAYMHTDNSIEIYIDLENSYKLYKWVLAHETYHHYQKSTNTLSIDKYKNKPKTLWPVYSARPWERSANRFANKVCGVTRKTEIFQKEA